MPSPTYTLQSDAETIGQRPTVLEASDENSNFAKWRMLAVAAIYALCLGSTFISYRPCVFRWDNSEYFARSIAVSRAFWSGDLKGLAAGMISIRPPAMTLMGLPWGSLLSQDTAGKCFITLAAAIGGLVATCQYLLLRIGMRPILIVLASVCVCVSLGPYPWGSQAHLHATGFEADSLFAWVVLAAALLIPYEMRTHSTTASRSALRGILWGLIFSLGVMIKLSFLFFVVPFALVLLC